MDRQKCYRLTHLPSKISGYATDDQRAAISAVPRQQSPAISTMPGSIYLRPMLRFSCIVASFGSYILCAIGLCLITSYIMAPRSPCAICGKNTGCPSILDIGLLHYALLCDLLYCFRCIAKVSLCIVFGV